MIGISICWPDRGDFDAKKKKEKKKTSFLPPIFEVRGEFCDCRRITALLLSFRFAFRNLYTYMPAVIAKGHSPRAGVGSFGCKRKSF
jgi:hypothetical protein